MFVKPKAGVQVRDPAHGLRCLPESGAEVPENSYWMRRLADGDVHIAIQSPDSVVSVQIRTDSEAS